MADQGILFTTPPEFDQARLRAFEADLTPEGVVQQFFEWLVESLRPLSEERNKDWRPEVSTFLDPAAGSGCYGKVARRFFPDARIVGIEIRPEERAYLERAGYDEVIVGDARRVLAELREAGRRFDVIATNSAFSLFPEYVRLCVPLLEPGSYNIVGGEREPAGTLALLYLSQWGQAAEHWPLIEEHCPFSQVRVGGRVKFRTGINPDTGKPWGADSREYCHWVWKPFPSPKVKAWRCYQLPPLEQHDRAWTVRPGTEEP